MPISKAPMKHKHYLAATACVLIASCGGGSGPAATPAPATPLSVPLKDALASLILKGASASFTMSGTIGGTIKTPISGTGTITISAGVPTTINGSPGLVATQILTGTQIVGGASSSLAATTKNFASLPEVNRLADESNSSFAVYKTYTVPDTVRAGDAGSAWDATIYQSRDKITAPGVGRIVSTYQVSSDQASSLLVTILTDSYGDNCNLVNTSTVPSFCLTSLPPDHVFSAHLRQSQAVYRIDANGGIKFVSLRQDAYADTGTVYQSVLYKF